MKDNEKGFDGIWKVMEKKEYDREFKNKSTVDKWVIESTNGGRMNPKGPDDEFDY